MESFFLSENVELNIFLMGVGTVGGSLLEQMHKQGKLIEEKRLKIKLTGIANSRKMLFRREIDMSTWQDALDESEMSSSLSCF